MTKLSAFLVAIFICLGLQTVKAQSFTFTIASPSPNGITDSVLNINVQYYTSTYELARITASSVGQMDTLTNAGDGGGYTNFNGSLNIAGLIQGNTYQLKVTCRDVFGNEKSDSVNYKYIKPPVAQILLPIAGKDIWPSLHIKTSHTGFDTCTSKVTVTINSLQVFTYTSVYNDIDTTIVLSNTLDGDGLVALSVTDKWGQSKNYYTSVLADNYHSDPYLAPVYLGEGKILDFNYNKILEVKSSTLKIVDSGFQSYSLIPGIYSVPSSNANLTPFGAIWSGYEWTNGFLSTHSYLAFAGKYATYKAYWFDTTMAHYGESGYNLYRRDLGSRTDILLSHYYDPSTFYLPMVDTSGSVIFFSSDFSAIFSSNESGITRTVYSGVAAPNSFGDILLHGDSVIYSIYNAETETQKTYYFNDGINTIPLSNTGFIFSNACKISGKYIAFPKNGSTGQKQIWLRDSTGNSWQKTFFGTDSYILGLNPNGDMIFSNSNKSYYLKKDSIVPKEIGLVLSSPFYKDNTWYVVKKNTLYKILVNAYRTVASGNWSNPACWQNGVVPPPGADVIVVNNITVDQAVTCNTLKVISPGSVTVITGIDLTVLH